MNRDTGRAAVIDLGTNTFHLLVAEAGTSQPLQEVYRERHFVNLGRSGLERIAPSAIHAAEQACHAFHKALVQTSPARLKVIGTAALRHAENAEHVRARLSQILAAPIDIIDGVTEATYMAQGALALARSDQTDRLIMDIGGGSVEFYHHRADGLGNAWSLPVGVAVLYNAFHLREPLPLPAIRSIQQFLDEEGQPLIRQLTSNSYQLVGAAGIYEVLASVLALRTGSHWNALPLDRFYALKEEVMTLTLAERLAHPLIPRERARLFPVALVLIDWVLQRLPIRDVAISPYALKEGILLALLRSPNDYSSGSSPRSRPN